MYYNYNMHTQVQLFLGIKSSPVGQVLEATTQAEHQMESGLLLDVVVAQSATVLELFPSKNETLLVWRDSFLVLNLGLHVFNSVTRLDFEGDRLSRKRLHKDLHATTQAEHKVKGGLLLDVVVAQSATIFKLLACKDESLLVWRNSLLVLDLGFDILDCVTCLDFQGDRFTGECFDEDLHATTQAEHKVKGGLLLDVVVTQSAAILELFPSENETLLVWRDAFLVLDLGLHVFDSVAGLNFEGDCLSGKRLHEDLHSTTQAEHKMKGGLLLDVVVTQSAAILELFPGENETLLVWRDAFLVLNLGLHVFDSVAGLNFEGDCLSGKRLHEDLHSTTQAEHKMKGGLLLDVVVTQSAAILELFPGENETLLVWRDAFLVLNLGLHVFDSVAGLNFEGDCLSGKRLHEDLHSTTQAEHKVKGGLLLDVVVTQSAAILELFPGENETLLVWRDAFLVLNLGLHVFDSVAGLNFEGDCLSGKRLHEDLHSTTQAEHKVKGGLLLDVVVAQSAAILELFPGENETLLVWRDAFLVLDLGLHVFNSIAGLDFEGDSLSGKCLHKDLHFRASLVEKWRKKGRKAKNSKRLESFVVVRKCGGGLSFYTAWIPCA